MPHAHTLGAWPLCTVLVAFFWLASCPAQAADAEFRAFWAAAHNEGYRTAAQVDEMVAYAVQANYNAIFMQVLQYPDAVAGNAAHGAFWKSDIVPWAPAVTAGFDPLAYACQKAHQNNLELHAWLYPFRAANGSSTTFGSPVPADGKWLMVSYAKRGQGASPFTGTQYWFDAGSPDVQEYYMQMVRELCAYEIDGIHWDYEISGTGVADNWYPADLTYTNSGMARYQRLYNTTDVPTTSNADWKDYRRRAINEFFRRCQAEVEAAPNPRQPLRHTNCLMTYGSPPIDCSDTRFKTTSSYLYYGDFPLWMRQGWLDAGLPMNYKREYEASQAADYRAWVDRFLECWRGDRHIFVGQGSYLQYREPMNIEAFFDNAAQITYSTDHLDGVSTFSYWYTRADPDGPDSGTAPDPAHDMTWYTDFVPTFLWTDTAPTPPMPWRDPTQATEGRVWGRVVQAGQPLDNVAVQVGSLEAVQTDGNGYYLVTHVPVGNHAVTLTIGLDKWTHASVAVAPAGLHRVDFPLVAADFNHDCRVNLADFNILAECATGPGIPYSSAIVPACTLLPDGTEHIAADLDADGDIDQNDFASFQRHWSGDLLANPSLAN